MQPENLQLSDRLLDEIAASIEELSESSEKSSIDVIVKKVTKNCKTVMMTPLTLNVLNLYDIYGVVVNSPATFVDKLINEQSINESQSLEILSFMNPIVGKWSEFKDYIDGINVEEINAEDITAKIDEVFQQMKDEVEKLDIEEDKKSLINEYLDSSCKAIKSYLPLVIENGKQQGKDRIKSTLLGVGMIVIGTALFAGGVAALSHGGLFGVPLIVVGLALMQFGAIKVSENMEHAERQKSRLQSIAKEPVLDAHALLLAVKSATYHHKRHI